MTLKLFKNFLHIERVKVLSISLKGYDKAHDVSLSYKSEVVNARYSGTTYINKIFLKTHIEVCYIKSSNEEQYLVDL